MFAHICGYFCVHALTSICITEAVEFPIGKRKSNMNVRTSVAKNIPMRLTPKEGDVLDKYSSDVSGWINPSSVMNY